MLGRIRKVAGKMSSDKEPIRGEVEADETFLGGKEKNKHAGKRTHSGGGTKGKQVVAGLRSRKGEVRLMQAWDIRLLGVGAHRNPLFHSSLSFLALRLLAGSQMRLPHILIAGYGIGLASHLWWDIVAFGDVRWLPGSALDRLWLGIHGLLCLVPSIPPLRRGGSPRPYSGAA